MNKHSAGPWRVAGGSGNVPRLHVMAGGTELYGVAHVFGETEEERLANGRVIAAAPEMLNILKQLVERFNSGFAGGCALIKDAEAVIAKAEGKKITVDNK